MTDLRKTSLIEAHFRMILVMKKKTKEGEEIPFGRTDLECGSDLDGDNDRVRRNGNCDVCTYSRFKSTLSCCCSSSSSGRPC